MKDEIDLAWWRATLDEFRQGEKRSAEFRDLVQLRQACRSEMLELLASFREAGIDLEAFRSQFDSKTRTDWAYFGLKGPAGAMFLNMLVKNLPDQEALTAELRQALALPQDTAAGRTQMQVFADYLEGQIEARTVTRGQVQPARLSFLLSAWWHLQSVEQWPIFYNTARNALQARGLYSPVKGDPVASYFAFREVYLEAAGALEVSAWEFEQLCAWLEESAEPPVKPKPEPPIEQRDQVWLYSPGRGAASWDDFHREGVAAIGWDFLGDLSRYTSLEELRAAIAEERESDAVPVNAALACYQFANVMQKGDVIYAKRGLSKILGRGVVDSDYFFDRSREEMKNVRRVKWEQRGEWEPREKHLVSKTLTEIGKYPGLVRDIEVALGRVIVERPEPRVDDYSIDHAVQEIFLPQSDIERLLALLESRKNVILQGPPGTGKSFLASRLAWLALGGRDPERLAAVQFHQSYSYEDFVQGYRPTDQGGFERRDGPFMRFCNLALQDQENPYVLIIDEINRGNLSKILGELMMLIEPDKRDARWATQLAYSMEDEAPFHVPPNLLLIGTMNTADRSLALVDYALRRRFAFWTLDPAFQDAGFQARLQALGIGRSMREQISERVGALNQRISSDPSLGRGFMVGHSYFCQKDAEQESPEEWLDRIARTELEPLLREYWFDAEEKAEAAVNELLEGL